MYTDPEGTFIFSTAIIIGIIVGAIIGGTIGGIYAYNEASEAGATGWELVGYTTLGILSGGTVGAFAGGFLGYAYPTVSAFMSTSFPLITVPHFLDGVIGFTTIYVTGSQVVAGGALITSIYVFSKQSKKSGKDMSSDKPSWVNPNMVDPNKSAQKNAADMLDNKYGPGNWNRGPGTEFNKIVKWIIRKILGG